MLPSSKEGTSRRAQRGARPQIPLVDARQLSIGNCGPGPFKRRRLNMFSQSQIYSVAQPPVPATTPSTCFEVPASLWTRGKSIFREPQSPSSGRHCYADGWRVPKGTWPAGCVLLSSAIVEFLSQRCRFSWRFVQHRREEAPSCIAAARRSGRFCGRRRFAQCLLLWRFLRRGRICWGALGWHFDWRLRLERDLLN